VDYPNVTLIVQIGAPTTKEVYVQRLGRTGRADQTGAGVLLLCSFERPFLTQLKDLPIVDISEAFEATAVMSESQATAATLQAAAGRVDDDLATQTYLAWLKTFNGNLRKMFKWSRQDLVDHANRFAKAVLGRTSTVPPVPIDVAVSMGLKDVTGLNLVEAGSLAAMDSDMSLSTMAAMTDAETESAVEQWTIRPLMLVINPHFRQQAKAVNEAITALTSAQVVDLQKTFQGEADATGEFATPGTPTPPPPPTATATANVGGFTITSEMVCIAKKADTPLPGMSRASSLASLGMSRNASSASLSRSMSTQSMIGMYITPSASLADMANMSGKGLTPPVPPATEAELAAALTRIKVAGEAFGTSPDKAAAQAEMVEAKKEFKRLQSLGAGSSGKKK
jgi:hypothetical protein